MWAPLQGFKYGPFANLRLQVTGPQVSAMAPLLLIARSPGAEGGGAPGAWAATESSLISP